MRKFAISYHNLLKHVIGLSKYESTSVACPFNHVPSCAEVLHNLMYRLMTRMDVCRNGIVTAIIIIIIGILGRVDSSVNFRQCSQCIKPSIYTIHSCVHSITSHRYPRWRGGLCDRAVMGLEPTTPAQTTVQGSWCECPRQSQPLDPIVAAMCQ